MQLIDGKYEVLEELSQGGMGTIYRVRHRRLGEQRVVKLIRSQLGGRKPIEERFEREARAAAKLNHENIVHLYDFGVDPELGTFMVLEYVDGVNLVELRKICGPLDLDLALEIGVQTLTALEYLHGKGLIHRDVSPDNIMLTAERDRLVVKLLDLGIAKSLEASDDLTQRGVFMGKFQYASPEQFDDHASAMIDGRSDVYSFGVVLFEAVFGQGPFAASGHAGFYSAHLTRSPRTFEEVDPEGRVPGGFRDSLLRALEKMPEARFQSAGEFAAALLEVREARRGQAHTVPNLLELLRSRSATEEPETEVARVPAGRSAVEAGPIRTLVSAVSERRTPVDRELEGEPDRPLDGEPVRPSHESPAPRPAVRSSPLDSPSLRPKILGKDGERMSWPMTIATTAWRNRRPIAIGAVVAVVVVGFFWLTPLAARRGAEDRLPEVEGIEPESDRLTSVDESSMPAAAGATDGVASGANAVETDHAPTPPKQGQTSGVPAAVPSTPPRRGTIALIGSDPELTASLFERLGRSARPFALHDDLASARGTGSLGIRTRSSRHTTTAEAYGAAVSGCEVTASAEVVRLPVAELLFSRSATARASTCGGALGDVADQLARELLSGLKSVESGRAPITTELLRIEWVGPPPADNEGWRRRLEQLDGVAACRVDGSGVDWRLEIYDDPDRIARAIDAEDGLRVVAIGGATVRIEVVGRAGD